VLTRRGQLTVIRSAGVTSFQKPGPCLDPHVTDTLRRTWTLTFARVLPFLVSSLVVFFSEAFGGQLFFSELLFNPPGADSPEEYIEIRGVPNRVLPEGTYLLAVEGDSGSNPGVIQNAFDLSGKTIGGNGFTVLL